MIKNSSIQNNLQEASKGGLMSSWTDPITVYRSQKSIQNSGPGQGILQGLPSAQRSESVYSYQKENPMKKTADAIKSIVAVGAGIAMNSILPGSGALVEPLMNGGSKKISGYDRSLLTGEIDSVTGAPVYKQIGPFKFNAPTQYKSILGDLNQPDWLNSEVNVTEWLKGRVDQRYASFLKDAFRDFQIPKLNLNE